MNATLHSILAVDASASMRRRAPVALKNAGISVAEAVDGQRAGEKADSRGFRFVLTDPNMPHMNRISLTKNLRENPEFKTTPTLVLTTGCSDKMKQTSRGARSTGWRVKPFDPAERVERVEVIGEALR